MFTVFTYRHSASCQWWSHQVDRTGHGEIIKLQNKKFKAKNNKIQTKQEQHSHQRMIAKRKVCAPQAEKNEFQYNEKKSECEWKFLNTKNDINAGAKLNMVLVINKYNFTAVYSIAKFEK